MSYYIFQQQSINQANTNQIYLYTFVLDKDKDQTFI